MSEPIEIDALLKKTLGAAPPPALRSTFAASVTTALRPRQLNVRARRLLRLYGGAAAVLSIAVMWSQGVEWSLIAAVLVVTGIIAAVVRSRCM